MISGVLAYCEDNKEKVHVIVTHWDMLHNPVEDWEKQQNNYIRQLSGAGYYGSVALAAKNIIHSSAYMYKLCRDFDNIDDINIDDLEEVVEQMVDEFNVTISDLDDLQQDYNDLEEEKEELKERIEELEERMEE